MSGRNLIEVVARAIQASSKPSYGMTIFEADIYAKAALAAINASGTQDTAREPDWIPWAGEPCPVAPHTRVDLRFIGGYEYHNGDGYVWPWKRVIAYRVVKP